jgi:uncharacterized protein (TIGR03067 family)
MPVPGGRASRQPTTEEPMPRTLLIAAIAALLLAARPADDAAAKKELDLFQGTWQFVSVEAQGNKVPAEEFKTFRIVYKGNEYTFTAGGGDPNDPANKPRTGTFKIDPTQKPKTIERTAASGPNQGKTFKGIYEFDGEMLKCCWAMPGMDRPKEFESKAEPPTVLEVMKKAK